MTKTYNELILLDTFKERFDYLKLNGHVGFETFGCDRYINQIFYNSIEWKKIRNEIILRDLGRDLGIEGRDIFGKIYIHHIEPITYDDIVNRSDKLFNQNNLISVSQITHNAIHYGDESILFEEPIVRIPNDTCPWRNI